MDEGSEVRDETATWRESPDLATPDEANGVLALTDSRLTFTSKNAGTVVDADLATIRSAQIAGEQQGRALLTVHFLDGGESSFWATGAVAESIVDAVHRRHH